MYDEVESPQPDPETTEAVQVKQSEKVTSMATERPTTPLPPTLPTTPPSSTPPATVFPATSSIVLEPTATVSSDASSRPPRKRKRIKRFGASSDKKLEEPEQYTEKLAVGINDVVYDPITYIANPVEEVVYAKDGTLDLAKNRIDFAKENWYEQFQYYRELLARQNTLNTEELEAWWRKSDGETEGRFTVNYAILTNACIIPPDNLVVLHGDKGKKAIKEARETLKTKDFYCGRELWFSRVSQSRGHARPAPLQESAAQAGQPHGHCTSSQLWQHLPLFGGIESIDPSCHDAIPVSSCRCIFAYSVYRSRILWFRGRNRRLSRNGTVSWNTCIWTFFRNQRDQQSISFRTILS